MYFKRIDECKERERERERLIERKKRDKERERERDGEREEGERILALIKNQINSVLFEGK